MPTLSYMGHQTMRHFGETAMNLWTWLNCNSGALQSVLAVVTILVLGFTWRAINVQANAARALTRVAIQQTQATRDAAESTKRQADLIANQLELNTAPLLVSELGPKVVNRGLGMAFHVHYWKGTRENAEGSHNLVVPTTLAPGSEAELRLPNDWGCWTICYKGSDGQDRWTTAYRDHYKKPQEHVIRKGTEEVHVA
jgi:hypothetical protein